MATQTMASPIGDSAATEMTFEDMADIPIITPLTREKIPLLQVVDELVTANEDNRLSRYNRRPMIKVHADARKGLPSEILGRVKPNIEKALGVDVETYLGKPVNLDDNYTAGTMTVLPGGTLPLAATLDLIGTQTEYPDGTGTIPITGSYTCAT